MQATKLMHVSAFDAISKKAGHDFTPQQDEKITDAARGAYEKYSVSGNLALSFIPHN